MLFALPTGTPAEDDIGGAGFDFIEAQETINMAVNEAEQTANERRSWTGFINAEISAFGFMARFNAEKYAFNVNAN